MGSNHPSAGREHSLERVQQVVEAILGSSSTIHPDFPGLIDRITKGEIHTVTTHATPGTEVSVAHTLKTAAGVARVPDYYIVLKQDKAGSLYPGTTAWSSSAVTFASDIATVAATVFIM